MWLWIVVSIVGSYALYSLAELPFGLLSNIGEEYHDSEAVFAHRRRVDSAVLLLL